MLLEVFTLKSFFLNFKAAIVKPFASFDSTNGFGFNTKVYLNKN